MVDFLTQYWAELLLLLLPILKLIARYTDSPNATWFVIVRKIVKAITPDDTDPKGARKRK